jgi:hypothetical protein
MRMSEYKCSVCGTDKDQDANFNIKHMLCNKHMTQVRRYGKTIDTTPSLYGVKIQGVCFICGSTDSNKYYIWQKEGELFGKELCSRHYCQMSKYNKITEAEYIKPLIKNPLWTEEEIKILTDCYNKAMPIKEISKLLNRNENAITAKASDLKFNANIIRKNSIHFKAIYQNYDWCYQKYVIERKSYEEMAEEAGTTVRTIQKWCSEKHRLNAHTLRSLIKLTDLQKELVMFSLLGDGHIDKRETQPIFIVSHAENQKDYLYWKYEILQNICNKEPSVVTDNNKYFNGKEYNCQNIYRISTKIIDDLAEIRSMSKSDIIKRLNEFGLSIHFLDDAHCSNNGLWELCYASFSSEERELYIQILEENFGFKPRRRKDDRYLGFNKEDSEKISNIIMKNIPNDLDIIKYKIFRHKEVS